MARQFSREQDEFEKETLIRIFERAMRLDRAGPFDQMGWLGTAYIWLHWDFWFQRVRPLPGAVSGAVVAVIPSDESLTKMQKVLGIVASLLAILTWWTTYGHKLVP